jgi:hypothetical protein
MAAVGELRCSGKRRKKRASSPPWAASLIAGRSGAGGRSVTGDGSRIGGTGSACWVASFP